MPLRRTYVPSVQGATDRGRFRFRLVSFAATDGVYFCAVGARS